MFSAIIGPVLRHLRLFDGRVSALPSHSGRVDETRVTAPPPNRQHGSVCGSLGEAETEGSEIRVHRRIANREDGKD